MKVNVITLYEGDYHYGVAALINSLIVSGFAGRITVYHRKEQPPWVGSLTKAGENAFQVAGCILVFKRTEVPRHLGYHKPFAALEEMMLDPECDAVVYADPDVLFLGPWNFFEEWIGMGVALCLDDNFPYVSEHHPWRKVWKELLSRATKTQANQTSQYANSGFFGVARADLDFLRDWIAITETFEREGGNTRTFETAFRHKAIVGDQDLMAVTLMGWEKPASILGREAMGFTGHAFILSHDIGTPKPWRRSFIKESLKGIPPSVAASLFLKHARGALTPYAAGELLRKRAGFKMARLISRVWSR